MMEMFGEMTKQTLVIFDLDGTLIHEDGGLEDFSVLSRLKNENCVLAIASRNDYFHAIEVLSKYDMIDYFEYIMADFRPKVYQVREIMNFARRDGIDFSDVVFIDDYLPNIQRIKFEEPLVIAYHFGDEICSLEELHELLNKA